jgi:mono/diheme cytochrome c family protein
MKKLLKVLVYLVLFVIVLVVGALSYIKLALPNVGEPTDLKIEMTDMRLERGRYLAHHVMVCIDCHSERDWSVFSGLPVGGTWGQGGERFAQEFGFPGKFIASNITPSNLGSWTDGEVFRAVTSGVGKDGRALFPIMPHLSYGQLDEEDIYSVIAYIRTLTPVEHATEPSKADFPMNFILNTIPQKPNFQKRPATTDLIDYGKYLVTAASCYDCHTKQEKGQFTGKPFAGGFEFPMPDGSKVISANITPHPTSGIGNWTEEQFIRRFKMYTDSNYVVPKVAPGEFQTLMPWVMYSGMEEGDLRAMYHYLKTLEPQEEVFPRFVPAQ